MSAKDKATKTIRLSIEKPIDLRIQKYADKHSLKRARAAVALLEKVTKNLVS